MFTIILVCSLLNVLKIPKYINIIKSTGSTDTQYYLIAETPGSNSTSNIESLFVNGSDFKDRMFEGTIKNRDGSNVHNYGKNNLPIELYEQTNGDVHVYWLVSEDYNKVALNIAATGGITTYSGNLSPVTPTGSKMTLTEHDYKPHPYSGMVHTCYSAPSTREKTVSIPGFTLAQGACVRVLFTNGNSVAYPTLNVNDTGAKEICCARGRLDTPVNNPSDISIKKGGGVYTWDASDNTVLDLYYDGSYWRVIGDPVVSRYYMDDYRDNVLITGINKAGFLY